MSRLTAIRARVATAAALRPRAATTGTGLPQAGSRPVTEVGEFPPLAAGTAFALFEGMDSKRARCDESGAVNHVAGAAIRL